MGSEEKKSAAEVVADQMREVFARLSTTVFVCPRCKEEYSRPMNPSGQCGPCDITDDEEKRYQQGTKKEKSAVDEIIGLDVRSRAAGSDYPDEEPK